MSKNNCIALSDNIIAAINMDGTVFGEITGVKMALTSSVMSHLKSLF